MNLPDVFKDYLNFLSADDRKDLLESLDADPVLSLRVSTSKWDNHVKLPKVPWARSGYYLQDRPLFNGDPLWHAGVYYVQEASSMMVGYLIEQLKKELPGDLKVLDLCGAPGGKTTDIASQLGSEDLLVSNEVIQSRASVLLQNVVKWGKTRHEVTNNDPADFKKLKGFFDIIVVDAPCSGEGMFRKDIEARGEWSPEHVQLCHVRQKRILHDVWDSLKEDGFLIYCTCTFNEIENEQSIEDFAGEYDFEMKRLNGLKQWGILESEAGFYRCLPNNVDGEGFSFCILQKKEAAPEMKLRKKDKNQFKSEEAFHLKTRRHDDEILPALDPIEFHALSRLKWWTNGMQLGSLKKQKLIPAHRLSQLSDPKATAGFEKVELPYADAIKYLQKEPFQLEAERGYKLLTYRNISLGFVNHLGNRYNSLLPSNMRIRSQKAEFVELHII